LEGRGKKLTLRKDFPLARLASRGVGEYLVELIEKVLHFTTTLPLGHLVANTKLWGATVVPTALSKRSVIETLEACDAAVLHRVVMSC
jgi:hypothetical protein